MASPADSVPESFEIVADVRYSDALFAALAQFRRRARVILVLYAASLAASVVGSWIVGGLYAWLAVAMVGTGIGLVSLIAWLTFVDFRRSGGRPVRMRYHVCGSGVEIIAAGRGDWVTWEDLWDAGETSRSFVLSPSPGEQYVIPKRCCDREAAAGLRQAFRGSGAVPTRG